MSKNINTKIKDAARSAVIGANVVLLRSTLPRMPQVKEVFKKLPANQRGLASISPCTYSDECMIYLTVRGLSSFKDLRLQRIIECFIDDDWHMSTQDYTEGVINRDFTFTKVFAWEHDMSKRHVKFLQTHHVLPPTFKVSFMLCAYVKADSASCHLEVVEVKEKVVREEIKRIVCA